MVELVRVAEQAVVAGRAASLRPALAVATGRRIYVTELERLAGDRGEAGRVLDETLEHADAALGRLPEQNPLMLPLPDQLDRDLLFLDLKRDLNGALERIGQGLEERRVAPVLEQRSQQQEVATVPDVRGDAR